MCSSSPSNPFLPSQHHICPGVRPHTHDDDFENLYDHVPPTMGLAEEAKRIAAQFDFGPQQVNDGVKAFLAQMHEGLQESGTQLSQIPTFVTAVPNGTEKVYDIPHYVF